MLRWLARRKNANATALQLYGSSVAQARLPVFYRDWCVADSFSGRFDLVALHVALLLRRLTAEGEAGKDLGRSLVEQMFSALDDDLRKIGVGDLTVPKKVRAAAGSFYGSLKAYDAALENQDDGALALALSRNVQPAEHKEVAAARLAAYVRDAAASLAGQDMLELGQGQVSFPRPTEIDR